MQNSFNPVQILLSLHAQGRFAEMEQRARELLRGNGNAPILNELLGISLTGQKKFSDALPFLQKAVRREPNDALFWENLALCQRELGEYAHAEKSLRQSLKIRPANAEALNTLGSVLRSQERTDEARAAFEQAIAVAPNHAAAHFNLGKLCLAQKKWKEAEMALNRAVRCGLPSSIGLQYLGRILLARGQYEHAANHFRRAIELDPDNYLNFVCLARAEKALGNSASAVSLVEKSLIKLGDFGKNLTADELVDLDACADILVQMDFHRQALAILKVTVAFENTGARACAAAFAARCICDWDDARLFEQSVISTKEKNQTPINPFNVLCFPGASAAFHLDIARHWAELSAETISKENISNLERSRSLSKAKRIRLGYLSSDFYTHATSILIAGVLDCHDRSRFELVGYDNYPTVPDSYRDRVTSAFDVFRELHSGGYESAAHQIADDDIDIVVDLKGWTQNSWSQVLVGRPARLQIQWLGYPGTMGASWIDYIVADRKVIRTGEELYYSERILSLPDCYQPNDDTRQTPAALSRGACGLPEDAFVFGCFNQSYKITPEVFDIWMRLLQSRPSSVLWLLASSDQPAGNLRREAAARGVAPDRLVFAPGTSQTEHLARIPNIDLALDCFPYGSHTTASDMLWSGVPMIGLRGDTFASRVSESILCAAGLPDLVASSYDEYFNLASQLVSDPQRLSAIRARVRDCKKSALFDTKRFTRSLERGFELIWERHLQGLPPDHIDVPPVQ